MFISYCEDIGCEPTTAPPNVVLNFLTILHKNLGYSYQSICGFRSAISKTHLGWHGRSIGEATPIHRLVKATFNQNPPQPRYADTWNPEQLLKYLETLHPLENLTDIDLSIKTVSLLALATISRRAQDDVMMLHIYEHCLKPHLCRVSSLAALGPDVQIDDDNITLQLLGLEKNSRPGSIDCSSKRITCFSPAGHTRTSISAPAHCGNPKIDLANTLRFYLLSTEAKRSAHLTLVGSRPTRLFVANTRPHQAVTPSTLAR